MGFWSTLRNYKKELMRLSGALTAAIAATAVITTQLVQCENPAVIQIGSEPSDGMYTIYEGTHNSVPMSSIMYTKPHKESGYIVYDSSAMYNLHSVDQLDWNKVVGIKRMHTTPMPQKTGILVERTDTLRNLMQFALYFNLPNDSIVFPRPQDIIDVPFGDTVEYSWEYKSSQEVELTLTHNGRTISKSVSMWLGQYHKIHPWHGGNMAAPTTRRMYLKKN